MINYAEVQRLTDQGIEAYSDGGSFEMIVSGAGVEIGDDGSEIKVPEVRATIYGGVRAISYRYIDGESIKAGDKRAFFSNATPIENGMIIIIEGKHWRVVDNRPVNPSQTHVIAYRPILRKVGASG